MSQEPWKRRGIVHLPKMTNCLSECMSISCLVILSQERNIKFHICSFLHTIWVNKHNSPTMVWFGIALIATHLFSRNGQQSGHCSHSLPKRRVSHTSNSFQFKPPSLWCRTAYPPRNNGQGLNVQTFARHWCRWFWGGIRLLTRGMRCHGYTDCMLAYKSRTWHMGTMIWHIIPNHPHGILPSFSVILHLVYLAKQKTNKKSNPKSPSIPFHPLAKACGPCIFRSRKGSQAKGSSVMPPSSRIAATKSDLFESTKKRF